jgi:hypothetical protein
MTDAQWGILGTTTVAMTTLILQLISTARERKFQREVQLSDRRYAEISRRRDARTGIYSELLAFVHEELSRLESIRRLSDLAGFDAGGAVGLRAKVGTAGGERIRSLFDAFLETLAEIYRMAQDVAAGEPSALTWQEFDGLRDKLRETIASLEREVARELDAV